MAWQARPVISAAMMVVPDAERVHHYIIRH